MKRFFLTLAVLIALTPVAHAADWVMDPMRSKLAFTGNQNGQNFGGGFKNFTAQIAFDPARPEDGHIAVTIDIASAYAGSADRDGMLPQKDWFNTKAFPQAQFIATTIHKAPNGDYQAIGTLSIKGVTRNVTLPFTLTPPAAGGDYWHAVGKLTLMRNDFGIGSGEFTGEDYVKHAVDVTVDLMVKPAN